MNKSDTKLHDFTFKLSTKMPSSDVLTYGHDNFRQDYLFMGINIIYIYHIVTDGLLLTLPTISEIGDTIVFRVKRIVQALSLYIYGIRFVGLTILIIYTFIESNKYVSCIIIKFVKETYIILLDEKMARKFTAGLFVVGLKV